MNSAAVAGANFTREEENLQGGEYKTNRKVPSAMARRPQFEERKEMLREEELRDLRRSLSLLSPSHALDFYRECHAQAAAQRKPRARVMQQLITAWKILRGWNWRF